MAPRLFLVGVLICAATFALGLPTQATKRHPPQSLPVLPTFTDVTKASGINFKNEACHTSQKYFIETMEGGVALFDYDGDGFLDIFLINGAALSDPMSPGASPDKSDPRYWNRLYHNNGDGTFTDVTEKAGLQGRLYGMGVATGDYDNDGNVDLLVTNLRGNILYHNNGDGTFTDVTAKAGLDHRDPVYGRLWAASAAWVDHDRDGWLDLFVSNYVVWDPEQEPVCERDHVPDFCHPQLYQ